MSDQKKGINRLEWSAALTVIGVIVLFSSAIAVTLIAPEFIDPSWKQASSTYQVQMYEVSDPNVYVSTSNPGGWGLQYVYHLQEGFTLHAYQESEIVRIIAPEELERYVTRRGGSEQILTTRVLLLRPAQNAQEVQKRLQAEWKAGQTEERFPPHFEILELFDPQKREAFAITETDGVVENWVDENFTILDKTPPYATEKGVIYINNPKEYRISSTNYLGSPYWVYDENGEPVKDLTELKEGKLRFLSREALIRLGEEIYRIEGCWYCHTDQTRTLVQDTVLNGSADYPAPPSSANEYIYQRVTFPGTRRIGPDLSRVGIKRPHRDWHMSHFWSPTSESKGSIMPSFGHFFDDDPAGTFASPYSVPNYKFEAIFQYLMTKGTRITPPNKAWWLGLDPIQTLDIIEGRKK
ncbi:MAG: cbb3-type cytochrome c oxidase subunit II [Chlamydiales bacterium]|nr:cbb3-type cytochrome c oxidase subunit II [Chlamydiales bacterium]